MKRNVLLLAFLTFTPIYAFGDFIPGRTRASAEAKLSVEYGDGHFEQVQSASAIQFKTDGRGYTKFAVRLNEGPALPFFVTENKPSRCGQIFVAVSEENGQHKTLQIDEINPAVCGQEGPVVWRARLTTNEDGNQGSRLDLSGKPEFFMLSQ